jgi:hypothetical protein
MLFSDERKHSLAVPAKDDKGNAVTVGWLVDYLCEEVMKETRKEMFVLDGHVYASVLILHRSSTVLQYQIIASHITVVYQISMYIISLAWVF